MVQKKCKSSRRGGLSKLCIFFSFFHLIFVFTLGLSSSYMKNIKLPKWELHNCSFVLRIKSANKFLTVFQNQTTVFASHLLDECMVGMSVVVWLIKGFDESVVDMPEAGISSTTPSFMCYLGSSLSGYRYNKQNIILSSKRNYLLSKW